jgi:hypothetical protein
MIQLCAFFSLIHNNNIIYKTVVNSFRNPNNNTNQPKKSRNSVLSRNRRSHQKKENALSKTPHLERKGGN